MGTDASLSVQVYSDNGHTESLPLGQQEDDNNNNNNNNKDAGGGKEEKKDKEKEESGGDKMRFPPGSTQQFQVSCSPFQFKNNMFLWCIMYYVK